MRHERRIGSSCVNSCVSHPNARYAAGCANELERYLDCFWSARAFTCDRESRTLPVGCDAELVAYEGCRSSERQVAPVVGAASLAPTASLTPSPERPGVLACRGRSAMSERCDGSK
jgi:hypothetical protein